MDEDPPPLEEEPPIVSEDPDPVPEPTDPVFGILELPEVDASPLGTVAESRAASSPETVLPASDDPITRAEAKEVERTERARTNGERHQTRRLSLISSQRMSEALDQLRKQIEDDTQLAAQKRSLIVSAAEGVTIATSMGLLSLLLRSGSLVGAALSAMPLWQRVDPLAVVALSKEEREKLQRDLRLAEEAEDEDADGVGRLFDEDPDAGDPPEDDEESRTGRPSPA